MDRNTVGIAAALVVVVALRKESVDRNVNTDDALGGIVDVALRKESVDRNSTEEQEALREEMSLSARRAWIEIRTLPTYPAICRSLSARRAWIEIVISQKWTKRTTVALRKESVDRNGMVGVAQKTGWGRSPQGERG